MQKQHFPFLLNRVRRNCDFEFVLPDQLNTTLVTNFSPVTTSVISAM